MGKFEKGQWVRCVGANDTELLTVGKVYKVDEVKGGYIDVELDNGSVGGMWSHRFEAWTPKVGDRVRLTEDNDGWGAKGDEGIVGGVDGSSIQVNFTTGVEAGDFWFVPDDRLELVTPLSIEAGKFYKTRDGRKVGPAEEFYVSGWSGWALGSFIYQRDGKHGDGDDHNSRCIPNQPELDLIAEWVDEPVKASNDNAEPEAKPKFKVGDIVKRANGFQPHQRLRITKADGDNYSVEWLVGGPGSIDTWRGYEFELVTPVAPTNPAIVCLIENGQPKPAIYPHVHADEGAASKEASRLASVHKGQKFGVYVLTQTVSEEKVYAHEWQNLAIKGEKIGAIKALRAANDLTLKGAKDAVEHWLELNAA